ncbi:MAG: hypothetical protein JST48_04535 [Bacteroidetes bacterium]|nr:hypothetical protein [Bacteroidota bacterium]
MEEKISLKAIDRYSDRFAEQLADSYFRDKEKINGKEILSFSEIKQVNLFVLKELMRLWNKENEKWNSPYFNYEAVEVQQSIALLKNILSNHILISKKDFLPLLKAAVSQTLFLVLAPYDYFSTILDRKGKGVVRMAELKNEVRYLKINRLPIEKLMEKLEVRQAEVITGNEAFGMLDHILEELNFTPEDVDEHIASFSKILPMEVAQLFESTETPTKEREQILSEKPEMVSEAQVSKANFKIKDHLTINQKFMFTKMLFAGDFEVFSKTIETLDAFQNQNQALQFIHEKHTQWDKESDEYEEFMAMVNRKFTK